MRARRRSMLALVAHAVAVLSVCFGQLGVPSWSAAHASKATVTAAPAPHARVVARRPGNAHVVAAHARDARAASPVGPPTRALGVAAAPWTLLPAPESVAAAAPSIAEVAHLARGPPAEG